MEEDSNFAAFMAIIASVVVIGVVVGMAAITWVFLLAF